MLEWDGPFLYSKAGDFGDFALKDEHKQEDQLD